VWTEPIFERLSATVHIRRRMRLRPRHLPSTSRRFAPSSESTTGLLSLKIIAVQAFVTIQTATLKFNMVYATLFLSRIALVGLDCTPASNTSFSP